MAFDGFFIKKIVDELNEKLKTGRINKINNISNTELIFSIRKFSNKKLLISIHSQNSRIHLTNNNYENPKSPSNFCTVLRKYINNSFIVSFEQKNNDRIIFIKLKNSDELGYKKNYYLILELMGKHSNIILTDEDYTIIEAIKNSYSIEYSRPTMAGIKYKFPPTVKKINPFNFEEYPTSEKEFNNKFLLNNFYGVSKLLSKQFSSLTEFKDFCAKFNNYNQPLAFKDNGKLDFYYYNFNNFSEENKFTSYSELLDFVYLENNLISNKDNNKKIYLFVKNKITKLKNKINILEDELEKAKKDNLNELKGQLLLANNYLYKKFTPKEVVLQNFYDENLENIKISLDENLSIEKNAENYFNKNKKNKRSIENIEKQILVTKEEINYFENLEIQIENAEISDLEEINEELVKHKYIKNKINKKQKNIKYTVINYEDTPIYIGKNNIQNDNITNKLAKRNYLWFHAKDIPGSHVVIFSNNPKEELINLAAMLAAYYSKFKNEDFVNVDYTLIKYVKKISGAKAGMVTYTNQKTLKIKIDKLLISKIINM
ncbi:NFACT family protein [Gemella sp. zg-1178]|uniref:Rqc2 family fibronectin-binding protein n=1 Tax=Gemella sp. zg-1178 TaxID=2840372 RepID=UPI001C05CCBE|nr:NFACT RNA binding domain-containing protein [Gemella sp. zg-1178]MBU0278936.1 NFACT family protein [Gemella sp. zg-1178]